MLTQREIEEKAYDILELVEMENKDSIDIITLAKRYGFEIRNAKFLKDNILAILKTIDYNKIIYIKKDMPTKAKRIFITRAFSKYMINKEPFVIYKDDMDMDSERLARAILMRKDITTKLVYMSTYIGKPLYVIEKELANIFKITRKEARQRIIELSTIKNLYVKQ